MESLLQHVEMFLRYGGQVFISPQYSVPNMGYKGAGSQRRSAL
jgi:hypothetical protein